MQTDNTVRLFFAVNRYKPILYALLLLSVTLLSPIESLNAQTKSNKNQNLSEKRLVNGIVKDAAGNPLPGVTVTAKGKNIGTATGGDGRFSINVPSTINNLTFSFVGMVQQVVSIEKTTNLKIVMEDESVNMGEVVVVGYGKQKKATVTGAVSSVESKQLVQSSQANISNALVGRLSGLTAVQKSGEPGRDQSTIRIRGIGSFATDANVDLQSPLVMVDGIETANYNTIDPNEIENVSILKDASATAVYGVRGANGVILITTKRGGISKPQLSYSSNFAVAAFTNLRKQMNSYDYAKSFNETRKYDGYLTGNYTPKFTDAEIEKYRTGSDPIFYPNTNWVKLIFKDYTTQTQHNLNINGGTEKVKYFVSVGYFSQQGMYNNTNLINGYDTQVTYDRYNFRSNFDFQLSKAFSISLNLSDQLENRNGPYNSSAYILSNAFAHPPTSGPGIVDGKLIENLSSQYNFIRNPLYLLVVGNGQVREYTNQLNGSLRFNLKLDALTKGLSAHAVMSYQNYNLDDLKYVKDMITYNAIKGVNGTSAVFVPQGTDGPYSVSESFGKNRKEYLEAGFDYSRKLGNHNLGGLLLYNQSRYYDPGLAFLIPNSYQGIVGRVTYDYKSKYLAEVNVGYNGTENFIAGKRFGLFPAFSAGWVASEEDFFPKSDAISFLKIRGSYGEVGNDKIGGDRFLYRPTAFVYNTASGNNNDNVAYWYGTIGSNYTQYTTSTEGKIGNPDLTWERSIKMNIGFDVSLWKDRIKITADLFKEHRSNILANKLTLPMIVGANLPAYNLGEMENGGFDGEFNFRDKIGKLNYWFKAIYTFARNKIIFKDEVTPAYPYMQRTGQRLNQYFGFVAEGFYNSWAEVNDVNRPVYAYQNNKIQPGDVKYKDVNGDGTIDSKDMVPIGYSDFPEVSYGFSFGADYKGFDFSVLFQGCSNVSLLASKKFNRGFQEDGSAIDYLKDVSWTQERYDQGLPISFPHLSSDANQSSNYQASTLWIRDASYIRLKNLEVGYSFEGKAVKSIGISSARIYINATNLLTFDKLFPGEDPEIPTYNDANYEPYPIVRTLNLGLNVKF